MAHCIRTFTDEVSEYSRKLVGIVQQIEGGEQIVEDGVGMAHTEHVSACGIWTVLRGACLLMVKGILRFAAGPWDGRERAFLRPGLLR